MNLKKTLYNINLSKEKFFNLRSGGLNWDVIKKNLVFIMNYKKYDWANNRVIDVAEKKQITNMVIKKEYYIINDLHDYTKFFFARNYKERNDFQL